MDPVMKMYMFYHWIEDNNEQIELFKHHGYLIGSFTNPEAVNKILGSDTHKVSEEDFEESSRMVREAIDKENSEKESIKSKRKRKKTKIN